MTEAFKRLKSGSDIRGVAVSTPEKGAELTESVGAAVGTAFARYLSARTGKPAKDLTIAVGRDSRVTGESLAAALLRGLSVETCSLLDCGLCTTPAMFMATKLLSADGAVMVTASHLPWQRNGYKFFTKDGGLSGADITAILEAASALSPADRAYEAKKVDFLSVYSDFLREKAYEALGRDKPLDGLHVVVDAGNGAGGFYADLLASLGADVSGSQFLSPDGRFPNHPPNPEEPAAMESLCRAVQSAGADLGVIFDADCDRAALVDGAGRAVNRNRLIALVSAVLLQETPGATIVTDSVTSAGLETFLKARGGTLHRFKRGYRNVIDEALRLNAAGVFCPLAIETSGHAALLENSFLDDGMYLVTRLILTAVRQRRKGDTLFALIDGLSEPAESVEVRAAIRAADFRPVGKQAVGAVLEAARGTPGWSVDPENREGVRVHCGGKDSWFLLRLSVHDPLLVLNAESDRLGGVRAMLSPLRALLSRFSQLDLSQLDAHLSNH